MEPLMTQTHMLILTTVLIRLIIALDMEEMCVLILQIGHANAVPCIADFVKVHVNHTGKCIRRFGGIYLYCRYFIDRKW